MDSRNKIWVACAAMLLWGMLASSDALAWHWGCVTGSVTSEIPFEDTTVCGWYPDPGDTIPGGGGGGGDDGSCLAMFGCGGGGGGGGGGPSYDTDPLSEKMDCAISHYSSAQPKDPVKKRDAWAYLDSDGHEQLFPTDQGNIAGSSRVFGSTPITGGTTYIYNRPAGFRHYPYRWYWIEPGSNGDVGGFIDPPFTIFETDLLITVHEIAHQNGIGVAGTSADYGNGSEREANGVAAQALNNYRDDNNGEACN